MCGREWGASVDLSVGGIAGVKVGGGGTSKCGIGGGDGRVRTAGKAFVLHESVEGQGCRVTPPHRPKCVPLLVSVLV